MLIVQNFTALPLKKKKEEKKNPFGGFFIYYFFLWNNMKNFKLSSNYINVLLDCLLVKPDIQLS